MLGGLYVEILYDWNQDPDLKIKKNLGKFWEVTLPSRVYRVGTENRTF